MKKIICLYSYKVNKFNLITKFKDNKNLNLYH